MNEFPNLTVGSSITQLWSHFGPNNFFSHLNIVIFFLLLKINIDILISNFNSENKTEKSYKDFKFLKKLIEINY
jgi:hypothetical protein